MQASLKKYFPIFVLPTLIAFSIAFVVPFIIGFLLSFTEFTTVTDAEFNGVQNYVDAFSKREGFVSSFGFTALAWPTPSTPVRLNMVSTMFSATISVR